MKYQVRKTITHEQGWSCAFRQWRAESHCRHLHGYALSVEMLFEGTELDEREWLIDFGSFAPLRSRLADLFDHRTVIAADDPQLATFSALDEADALSLVVMPKVGCEAFAEVIAEMTDQWIESSKIGDRVRLVSVEVREHGSNGSVFVC